MATPYHVHLLGIGGAGMAALAKVLQEMGLTVSGSDRLQNHTAQKLKERGIPIGNDHDVSLLKTADCCVYSSAFDLQHPLLQYAINHIPTYSRGEMTGQLSRMANKVIAVAGTHGKTTVSAWLTYLLLLDQKDPSALLGGHFSPIGGNGRWGCSDYLVCEACEFNRNFLHLKRDVGILLNIDDDHLECYGDKKGLTQAFAEFTDSCSSVVVCGDDAAAKAATRDHPHRICYGLTPNNAVWGSDFVSEQGQYTFTLHLPHGSLESIRLPLIGKHHVYNALAVATVSQLLGIQDAVLYQALTTFPGVQRRFQTITKTKHITVVDDYAHHPTEIAATLAAAKKMGFTRITAIFQPFTYSRTATLHRAFGEALSLADRVILAPIMAGREPNDPDVTSHLIAQHLSHVALCRDLTDCAKEALAHPRAGELLITMGCGDVYLCAEQIKALLLGNERQITPCL
ncbi:MAG: UDP-N-acetylmuramate--L-alanine ligase [Clostridia bacterium]|nr:UDP-N-acetylmuramate--L-alanine ligase [Clostridia bacterium]